MEGEETDVPGLQACPWRSPGRRHSEKAKESEGWAVPPAAAVTVSEN